MTTTEINLEHIKASWDSIGLVLEDKALRARLTKIVQDILLLLDKGQLKVAEKKDGIWSANDWIKNAILMSFKLLENKPMNGGYDKMELKFSSWHAEDFNLHQLRVLPGAVVRLGAYIGKNCIIMPSFINLGAHIGDGTLIDSNVTVGSCAQIGKNCHISAQVAICGVLEPLHDNPVIIEDNCFIGAACNIGEGAIVGESSVLGMGVNISGSTKILNRETNEITYGRIPPYSVVVPGSIESKGVYLACAIIIKKIDANTKSKTSINQLLRY